MLAHYRHLTNCMKEVALELEPRTGGNIKMFNNDIVILLYYSALKKKLIISKNVTVETAVYS